MSQNTNIYILLKTFKGIEKLVRKLKNLSSQFSIILIIFFLSKIK